MTRVYYKEAVGAMIVFDVTREKTFQAVTKWKADIDENLSLDGVSGIPVVLLANKCDLAEEPLDKEMMDKFCKEHRFIAWYETSAKENVNIDEAGQNLVDYILKNDAKKSNRDDDQSGGNGGGAGVVDLKSQGNTGTSKAKSDKCSC